MRSAPLLAFLLSSAGPLAAQAPALEQIAGRVAHAPDVRALEKVVSAARVEPGSLEDVVTRSLAEVRRYELTADRAVAKRSRQLAEEALGRYPGSAWIHYAFALAHGRGPEIRPPGILRGVVLFQSVAEAFGVDARSQAVRALRRALALDSLHAASALELAAMATDSWNADELADAATALRRIAADSATSSDADVHLHLARVLTRTGDQADAVRHARDALGLGAPRAQALLARAAALLRMPDSTEAGGRAWLDAVAAMDSASARELKADLLVLLDAEQEAAWDSLDAAGRAAWLERFWETRAAYGGVGVAERIAEHYRRLASARTDHPRQSRFGAPPPGAVVQDGRSRSLPVDQMGMVYVRYGEPDAVIRTVGGMNLPPNETWVYRLPDGRDLSFHFVKHGVFDRGGAPGMVLTSTPPCHGDYLADRSASDERLRRYARSCGRRDPAMLEATAAIREDTRTALRRELATPAFARDVAFFHAVYAFRSDDGRTRVVGSVAVPSTELRHDAALELIVLDTVTGDVARARTVVPVPDGTAADGLLRAHVELDVTPSATTVFRLVVREREQGAGGIVGGAWSVEDYAPRGLRLSDVVLADVGEGSWRRGERARLALVPPQRFEGGQFTLFYELYDLPRDAPYRTEIVLERPGGLRGFFGGARRVSRLTFDDVADPESDRVVRELRAITIPDRPGRYRLRVTVVNGVTGERAEQEREFEIP